jgi:mannose-1-phosphate guanylyltransferase/mannose-6-phosphate isomerase
MNITPVILCGGSGTRLWPLSRSGFPKQFIALSGEQSLFQQAVQRVQDLAQEGFDIGDALIVTNEEHRFLALDQLKDMPAVNAQLILEPAPRNTAPALTLAALQAVAHNHDAIMVVSPADHAVQHLPVFQAQLAQAVRVAQSGGVVTLGITPTKPETGYGYIKASAQSLSHGQHAVERFVEKPNLETAQHYLDSGGYFWNSGIFILKASVWLEALQAFRPDIAAASQKAWQDKTIEYKFGRPNTEAFMAIPSESIDYAVMEKCPGSQFPIHTIPLDAGWSDLGSWDAVWELGAKDPQGNVQHGDVLMSGTQGSLVYASSRLVTTVGIDDIVIVETADAVLVAHRDRSQDVKAIVQSLSEQKRFEQTLHRKVHRPWGWYDSVDEGERFKVKRICVNPGGTLSLQKHHQRAEHWIVVKGMAEVTCNEQVKHLNENESTFIPLGAVHRLHNPGTTPLELIEVQTGGYLGEDDIVRFEDSYGRSTQD